MLSVTTPSSQWVIEMPRHVRTGDVVRLCRKIRKSWELTGFPPPSRGHSINRRIHLIDLAASTFLPCTLEIDDVCIIIETRHSYSRLLHASGETGWMHSDNLEPIPDRCI